MKQRTANTYDLSREQLLKRELAQLRATQAPVIFFEAVYTFGVRNGVCRMTLATGEATTLDGAALNHIRTVAHVRFPVAAIRSIREALDGIQEQTKLVPKALRN